MRRAILLAGMSIGLLSACHDETNPTSCARDNGGCDSNAACVERAGSVLCICKPDYVGSGYACSKTGLQADAPWPVERGNAAHTGQSIHVGSQTGQLLWAFKTASADDPGDHSLYPPVVGADGAVYAGCADGKLYAINPDGGSRWTFSPTSASYIWSTPAIGADGMLYVTNSGWLYGVGTAGSGGVTAEWSFKPADMELYSSPVIGADGNIYADAASPDGQRGKLYAIDPLLHAEDWSFDITNYPDRSPAIGADGTLYVIGEIDPAAATLYAVRPGTPPERRWSHTATGCFGAIAPAVGPDGTVYAVFTCDDGVSMHAELFALDPETNDPNVRVKWKWALPDGSGISRTLGVGADGTVYVAGRRWPFYALNPNAMAQGDTTPKWTFSDEDTSSSPELGSPAIGADGMVYIAGWAGIYAIKDANRVWYYEARASDSTPAIAADGTVYVSSEDGHVYAFRD